MEVNNRESCPCQPTDLETKEGEVIRSLKDKSAISIPDPDKWLDEDIKRNMLLTTVDWAIDWARRSALWTTICFPACCAFEFIATAASRFDISRFGMEIMRASPRQADLMITAGTLTWKMAPQVKRIYDQMPEPKWVIAMGACACSGGIFANSYAWCRAIITLSRSTYMFRVARPARKPCSTVFKLYRRKLPKSTSLSRYLLPKRVWNF